MDGTNHSRGSTLQSLSPDKREDLEHELRPEALASIAREENAEASTNTTHAAVSPKTTRASEAETRAETASTGRVPRDASTHADRAVRIVPGRWKAARVAEEKSCGATDKPVLSLERKPRELPTRRLQPAASDRAGRYAL